MPCFFFLLLVSTLYFILGISKVSNPFYFCFREFNDQVFSKIYRLNHKYFPFQCKQLCPCSSLTRRTSWRRARHWWVNTWGVASSDRACSVESVASRGYAVLPVCLEALWYGRCSHDSSLSDKKWSDSILNFTQVW